MSMDEYFGLYLLLGIGLLGILYSFQRNYMNFLEKSRKNEYYIRKARIKRQFEDEDEEDEVSTPKIKLPSWAYALGAGAGIDVDALMQGDEEEVNKVQPILNRFLKKNKDKENDKIVLD